jgi:Mg2+-importing ATPase
LGELAYWSVPVHDVAVWLESDAAGLSTDDAEARLERYGANTLEDSRSRTWIHVLGNQLRSPLLLLLVFAAIASGLTREWVDAGLVLGIVVTTVAIGFVREYSAETAARSLRARLRVRTRVVRDGRVTDLAASSIVPGDVVLLSAGSLVPGDGVLLEATDFFVSESVLTGESFPVEKRPGVSARTAGLAQRANCVFFGTNVRSGSARCLIVETGSRTAFGAVAAKLARKAPEADFDRGLRHFGYLLTTAMLALVLAVFAAHVLRGRPAVETLLFSIALAVGLSPELLPAILSINLARAARMLAGQGVLVRRLNAIENLGSMDVLCTDKTGTLTEGVVRAQDAFDPFGVAAADVFELAACNAQLETGLNNPLDDAILHAHPPDLSGIEKCGEVPFDFARRRVTVVITVARLRQTLMITKGAFSHVLEACSRLGDGRLLDRQLRAALAERYEGWSRQGIRVIAVATRDVAVQSAYSRSDERDMVFRGFVTFLDRPKPGVSDALAALAALGVSVKLITGDNGLVARHMAGLVGLRAERLVTGRELNDLHGGALHHAVEDADVFAEVDPGQKERIILALKRAGHVVGFLGDGVNDAPAMHAADTSLSVESAVDVAREAADFVLLERGLDVIRRGVEAGRRTFANTMKYVLITTSANLGNMVSMAAASMVLPFLPLLAGQILLNNLLSDIPAVGLADDGVDQELVARPERWDMRFIGRFMVVFGLISSLFDVITFGVLRLLFHADPDVFRTTWFVESLLTELLVALVVRTRRPFFRSRPGHLLLASTMAVAVIAVALPFVPGISTFGFVPLSSGVLATVVGITAAYLAATELAKAAFYRSRGQVARW